jgi:GDP-mannose 6-dehydrogenase
MAERFIGKGLKLKIYDPEVSIARLVGANRRYIEEVIPHSSSLMCDDPALAIDNAQALVVGLRTEPVLHALRAHCRADHLILDLVNIPDRGLLKGAYRGVCW